MNRRNFLKLALTSAACIAAGETFASQEETAANKECVAIGAITGDVLAVEVVRHGHIEPGAKISGCGISDDTFVITHLSGNFGGCGTYIVSGGPQSVPSCTMLLK